MLEIEVHSTLHTDQDSDPDPDLDSDHDPDPQDPHLPNLCSVKGVNDSCDI